MTVVEQPQERAWVEGVARTVAAVGAMNVAVAELVATIRMLIDTEGWGGHGIQSIEHWVCWQAGMSRRRAGELVRIARRLDELPECWALFRAGRLTEDAMVRIARHVPAHRDTDVAAWAPGMLISQLARTLRSCPEVPDPDPNPRPDPAERERFVQLRTRPDGWGEGELRLPPDEMAALQTGLQAARDAEYRDRHDLPADAEVTECGSVSWADALVRLATAGTDALDPAMARRGHRSDRTKVVLHHDLDPTGELGPGQLHLGAVVPDSLARFLSCDAEVMVAAYQAGRLLGIHPTQRTVNRATRRAIEHRDKGCTQPLCAQRRWLHVHHLRHWAHGGRTRPANLICLCPTHHRQLHHGELRIEGDPEAGTLRFFDARGHPIEPPEHGPPPPPTPGEPNPYTPPHGERLDPRWFSWN